MAEDYAGFDLDLEGVDAADRDALSPSSPVPPMPCTPRASCSPWRFPAKDRDVTVGWAGPYDYAALGAAADLVTVMAYEYRGPFSGPGLGRARTTGSSASSAFATRRCRPTKCCSAWRSTATTGTRRRAARGSVGYPQALALAEQYGVDLGFDGTVQSATFGY